MRPSEIQLALDRLLLYRQDYLGCAEIAIVLSISKTSCASRRRRGQLPVPQFELAMGPVWSVGQVRVWLLNKQRE
jgi:hypothetical protein